MAAYRSRVSMAHARGALLGLFVGDAAGATLEFLRGKISVQMARQAMRMPGSGWVGPGQVTDDSELSIALATALAYTDPSHGLPLDAIAMAYKAWFESKPFDVGSTCSIAFRSSSSLPIMEQESNFADHIIEAGESKGHLTCRKSFVASSTMLDMDGKALDADTCIQDLPYMYANAGSSFHILADGTGAATMMKEAAALHSQHSESNGALMRIVPMAIWLASHPAKYITWAAKQDAQLSHPNLVCQECNAAYALALAHLLIHPTDKQGALDLAQRYAYQDMVTKAKHWLLEDSRDIDHMDCTSLLGHVRHAFTLSFFFLCQGTSYEEAIEATLQKGGDTDTNAAIVGGLLGALHGADSIPAFMKDPVLFFDCSTAGARFGRSGQLRPIAYSTKQTEKLLSGLLQRQ